MKIKVSVGEKKVADFEIRSDGTLWYQERLYVPDVDGLWQRIVVEAHESCYVVHNGSTKMYHDLKVIYWWSGMMRDVVDFVSKCLECQ